MHLRLKHLLAVIFTVVAIVPVLIMALWVERTALEKEMAAVHEKHLLLAKNMTAALDRYSHDVESVFRFFAKSNEPDKLMSENATELARSIGFKSIQIVDGTGRLVRRLTGVADSEVHLDPKTIRPLLPKAEEELKFSGVLPDAAGHPTILLYQRLATDRIAVAALSTDYFVKLQTAITFGRKGHAAIVDRNGGIIAHPQSDWRRAMKNLAKVGPVQKMMAGQSGVTQFYSPAVKKQMVSGYTTVARTGWGVMVPQPLDELVEKARGAQQLAIAIAFLGVVAAALLSWMLANALIRPIEAVVNTAESLANGELAARDPHKSRIATTELRDLASNFDDIAHRIQDDQNRLHNALALATAADRAKSEFLANVSHELRTPLNAIIGFSDTIKHETLGPIGNERYNSYAAYIHQSGQHLLSIINNILDLSKIEAGKVEIENDTIDIPKLVDDAFLLIAEQAENNNVRLRRTIESGVPNIRGSEVKLRQVLLNLLSNAVKCISGGGQVSLAVQRAGDGDISFAIADTGIGMSQADIAVAFEAFGQAHSKTSRRFDGAGLGLPLTKRLVELHGGDIHIESAEGVGTTVTVTLPASRAVAKTA